MLKESMYNIITEVDDGMLIYNTLSAGLLSLNSAYSKAYDPCPNDTSFCVIESGGPTCTERSCGVFFG